MPDDFRRQIRDIWTGLRKRVTETVSAGEASFARGRVAATPVYAEDGTLIVDAGHVVDDAVIARAEAAGRLHHLALSAGVATAQDLKERAREAYERTAEGRESRSLNQVEEFVEARACIGRVAGADVLDMRGRVVVAAGEQITDEVVQRARDAGQLGALVHAARTPPPALRQAGPSPESAVPPASAAPPPAAPPHPEESGGPDVPDGAPPAPPERPPRLPLVLPPDS